MPNARFTQPAFEDGQTVEGWNLTQILPHTPIGVGVTGLRFVSCNLLNCDVPEDAVVEDCLAVQKSFCSHLHPEWVAKGLPECEEDCEHVAGVEEIIIGGETIVLRTYEDKGVA